MTKRVIIKPVLTEKSMRAASLGQYAFKVDIKACKKEIAHAIKAIFGVDVIRVTTSIRPGKRKRLHYP